MADAPEVWPSSARKVGGGGAAVDGGRGAGLLGVGACQGNWAGARGADRGGARGGGARGDREGAEGAAAGAGDRSQEGEGDLGRARETARDAGVRDVLGRA